MERSDIELINLPDEILLTIFKHLDSIQILYSLLGAHKRLNTIVQDSIFTRELTFFNYYRSGLPCPLGLPILYRLGKEILPEIYHKIEWLNLEPICLDVILFCTNYPNLRGLGLYGMEKQAIERLFTEDTLVLRYKNQLSSLVIDIIDDKIPDLKELIRFIFTHICVSFPNLKYLNYGPSLNDCQRMQFVPTQLSFSSSTLLELHINLFSFADCIYILDGRFNQLHTLYLQVFHIVTLPETDENSREKLPTLKCFSLCITVDTNKYDELIVPLLHRMVNLEKLDLQFPYERKTFIDGHDLKINIVDHLLRLNTFTFNITTTKANYETDLPSNEDMQQTFKDFKYRKVITHVDHFQNKYYNRYYVYTYPYKSKYYFNVTNNFRGGIFPSVHIVSLFDDRPFEHEFFLRIAQSFPCMRKLEVINREAQKNKEHRKSQDADLSIAEYHHLTELCLYNAHEDYAEEFLFHTKTYLPDGVKLLIGYQRLETVTKNFESDETRINCSKITYVYSRDMTRLPKHFKRYFFYTNPSIH